MDQVDESTIAIAMLGIMAIQQAQKKKTRKRTQWTKQWLMNREKYSHMTLLRDLKENNPDDFRNYLRMPDEAFQMLLSYVAPHIRRQDTVLRQSITAEQRLIATLRFLATGRTYEDLKFTTGISAQSLGRIIPETCAAIVKVLQTEYLKLPTSVEEWLATAKQFQDYWNFPNCGGAIDGKHVRITPPANSGSYYYNYKGYFSIVLMAIVNARYEFIFVDIGKNGRNSDGGVIDKTEFSTRLKNGSLNLPSKQETVNGLNFVFIADEAFGLGENLLKPFPMKNLTPDQRIYNYRLSRARRVVENAFGIMANRFRIFHTAINVSPDNIDIIVHSCCVLHNFMRRTASSYMPQAMLDREDTVAGNVIPGDWRSDTEPLVNLGHALPRLPSQIARQNRVDYMQYFVGPGAVDWQNNM